MIGMLRKRVEREQIGVTADDQIRMAIDRQLQEFVVLGVAAGDDALSNLHELRGFQHPAQPIQKTRRDQWC